MLNILILTASIGNGHNQVAKNLQESLRTIGFHVTTIDFLEVSPHDVNNFFSKAYKNLLKYKPDLFRQICRFSENETLGNIKYMLAKINRRIIARLVCQYEPDIIVCTHFFPLAAAAAYKKSQHSSIKLIGFVTDYTVHPIWQINAVDQYFIAHPSLLKQFHALPPGSTQIFSTGIPVGADFTPVPRQNPFPRILVMTGHQTPESLQSILTILLDLPKNINITFITGKDSAQREKLSQIAETRKNFKVIGFTEKVANFMKSSDILITKPGGSTITEALATAIPTIVFSPIPGIEEENARFLSDNQLGLWATDNKTLETAIHKLLKNPLERQALSDCMLRLHAANAPVNIQKIFLAQAPSKKQVAL